MWFPCLQVYFVPDDTTALIAAQAVAVLVLTGAGAASYGGSLVLATLQEE